jgi:predicted dehydrogenase
MPTHLSRRDFQRRTIGTVGVAVLGGLSACSTTGSRRLKTIPKSEPVRLGVVGIRSRGMQLANGFQNVDGCEVVAMCDCDAQVLEQQCSRFAEKYGHRPQAERDVRAFVERDDLHGIVIATPNHWHALMTMWACEAGKHVYVEKPVCHDLREGQAMAEVARRTGRIVATGTQARSSKAIADALAYLRSGAIGATVLARGTCWKPRKSIGRVAGPQSVPGHIDYDLWVGPAPMKPLSRNSLHYDWHWDLDTGNGDLGNQGIHQMDLCRWMLGEDALARGAMSVGGRLGYQDDGNSPNSQVIVLDYPTAPLIFEVRGLPRTKQDQQDEWAMDSHRGSGITACLECEGGELVVYHGGASAKLFDHAGKEMKAFTGGGNHSANFVKAVRNGDSSLLSADIETGRISSTLCHQGMASHLLGRPGTGDEALAAMERVAGAHGREAVERLTVHLRANEVDIDQPTLTIGAALAFDPATERHIDRPDADDALERPARAPFSHELLT